MTRLKNISRLLGAISFALILAAAPVLQAAQQAADCAPVKTTCGCSCCSAEAGSSDDLAIDQGSCGCTVSDMESATETPLDLQPRPNHQSDTDASADIDRPDCELVQPAEEFAAGVDVPKEHSPPLYILHSSYLI
jgi:hypothetical protein